MDIEIETYEFVKDSNGGHFKKEKEIKSVPDSDVRHNELCTLCGFPDYPKCRKYCRNEKES